MPLPKKQHSVSRSRKHRTHWKLKTPQYQACPECKKPVLSHRVCAHCGFYKGKQVLTIKRKKVAEEKS